MSVRVGLLVAALAVLVGCEATSRQRTRVEVSPSSADAAADARGASSEAADVATDGGGARDSGAAPSDAATDALGDELANATSDAPVDDSVDAIPPGRALDDGMAGADGHGGADALLDVDVDASGVLDAIDAVDGSGEVEGDASGTVVPLLRLEHVQALGTHNSYHVAAKVTLPMLDYTHPPLDEQVAMGVRQFELDIHFDPLATQWRVYHVAVVDEASTCDPLTACLQTLAKASKATPGHAPFVVLLEVKTPFAPLEAGWMLDLLEEEVLSVWPIEDLVTPDLVRGAYPSLREAVEAQGWPPLDSVRDRALFVLHDKGLWRSTYTDGNTTTEGRVLFPDAGSDLDMAIAAFHTMNDPVAQGDLIAEAVLRGHLVRTRADANLAEADPPDYTRAEAALASGAQFVSTDFPYPGDETSYGVVIPGGTPVRCNPVNAPAGCTSEAIEDHPVPGWGP